MMQFLENNHQFLTTVLTHLFIALNFILQHISSIQYLVVILFVLIIIKMVIFLVLFYLFHRLLDLMLYVFINYLHNFIYQLIQILSIFIKFRHFVLLFSS
jgi:hypothetical protein